jgi:hypothetical protein
MDFICFMPRTTNSDRTSSPKIRCLLTFFFFTLLLTLCITSVHCVCLNECFIRCSQKHCTHHHTLDGHHELTWNENVGIANAILIEDVGILHDTIVANYCFCSHGRSSLFSHLN